GSIVEFTGKPFEKTILKGRGFKVLAKAFTLPDVIVGSIVEYKFRLKGFTSDLWVLQHPLYTVRQSFSFHPLTAGYSVAWVTSNLPGQRPQKNGENVELQLDAMPAFEAEALMPPEDVYKPYVRFYYLPSGLANPDRFWDNIGKQNSLALEKYIGNRKE